MIRLIPSTIAWTLVVTISSPTDFDEIILPRASSTFTVTSHNALAPPEIESYLYSFNLTSSAILIVIFWIAFNAASTGPTP